ncbi:MAG: Gfo/Idh/MocA family oxidoreductase [Nanoarchaeota archaeon]
MKPLRFGLLGLGYFGRNYVGLLQGIKGVELAAVCSRTAETLAKFKDSITASAIKTTDSSVILENPNIDCVVIATPAHTHFSLAKEALENGKHVLLEKPMTTSLEDAKQLKALVVKRKGNGTFMVGHQFVYHDYIRHLRSLISANSFGKVKCAFGEHILFPSRPDVGCLWDAGTHQLSMLQYLLRPGKIVKVFGRSVDVSGSGVDDFTAAAVEFKSGLLATIIVSWRGAQKTRRLALFGESKLAVFDDVQEKDKLKLFSHNPEPEIPRINAKEPLRNELEHFVGYIRTGESPLTGIDSSYEITEWLDKISGFLKQKQ